MTLSGVMTPSLLPTQYISESPKSFSESQGVVILKKLLSLADPVYLRGYWTWSAGWCKKVVQIMESRAKVVESCAKPWKIVGSRAKSWKSLKIGPIQGNFLMERGSRRKGVLRELPLVRGLGVLSHHLKCEVKPLLSQF